MNSKIENNNNDNCVENNNTATHHPPNHNNNNSNNDDIDIYDGNTRITALTTAAVAAITQWTSTKNKVISFPGAVSNCAIFFTMDDLKHKAPKYKSDMKPGVMCLSE